MRAEHKQFLDMLFDAPVMFNGVPTTFGVMFNALVYVNASNSLGFIDKPLYNAIIEYLFNLEEQGISVLDYINNKGTEKKCEQKS